MSGGIVLNERELREARARAAKLSNALSSERVLRQVVAGLPPEVVVQVTQMMKAEARDLEMSIAAYETAKQTGRASALHERAGSDPGITLMSPGSRKDIPRKISPGDSALKNNKSNGTRLTVTAQLA